jgi:hypothetical protein
MEEVPFQDRTVPKVEMDWDRSFWWWYPISRAVHPAIRMTNLWWSLIAVIVLQSGIGQAEKLFSSGVRSTSFFDWFSSPSLLSGNLFAFSQDFRIPKLTVENLAFLTFVILWLAFVGSIFGGVLARRAAFELGQRTIAPWFRSIKLVASRLISYLWAAGMHFLAIGGLLLPFYILGWISRLGSVPAYVAGVFLIVLSIPLMFAIGRLFLSLIACFPLSVCAISIEKRADAFEGFSRSNAYFFQRPVLAAILVVLLLVFGEIGALLVSWVVYSGWGLIGQSFLASGLEAQQSFAPKLGDWIARSLVMAYRFSFFWAAASALYLVLRRCVDSTDLDEMDACESEIERNPPMIPSTSQPSSENNSKESPSNSAPEKTSEADPPNSKPEVENN